MSATLLEALLAFQKAAPTLQKDAINPHFKAKYVSLDKLTEAVTPVLNEHGLVWLTKPVATDAGPSLEYELIHVSSGERVSGVMPLLLKANDPQGQGSALTYARRYSMMTVLGLVANEDDDGKRASRQGKESSGPRFLTDGERAKVLKAITDAGHDEDGRDMLLGAVGAESIDLLTTAQAFELRKLLDGEKR